MSLSPAVGGGAGESSRERAEAGEGEGSRERAAREAGEGSADTGWEQSEWTLSEKDLDVWRYL